MKVLFLHCDYFGFRPTKKAIKNIEEIPENEKQGVKLEDVLAVLIAVEKSDTNEKEIIDKLIDNVRDVAKQVNSDKVILYPYAHLSKNLGSPEVASKVLNEAEKQLSKYFETAKAPFGYYKEFEMKIKGHPLSELSREINVENSGKDNQSEKKNKEKDYDPKQLLNEISKSKLDTSKLKENDHRIIGKQMDLYSFHDVAPGMVFWHNNGLIIRNELINFWRDIHKKQGYEEILTPQVLDSRLWKISGHWEKFRDNIFLTDYEDRQFGVKPMNCPGGILIYKTSPKSYKDFPLKVGELGVVHRVELSGTLGGLFRVIQFTQDDAHIYCTKEQMADEISKIVNLAYFIYEKFNLEVDHVELSTRPEKRIGEEKMWDLAEETLENVLKNLKVPYKINKGDGAFYGPKIDFHLKDSLNRTWQCGTFQLDFSMPERFNLEYTDKDNKKKRPVMIHRTIFGSLERFLGILIENTKGRLPTWLSPIQVRVLSFTDRNIEYAKQVIKELGEEIPEARIDADFTQTTIPSKVKQAELMRVPYIITVGDREEKEKTIAVRTRGNKKLESYSVEDFKKKLKKEIEDRE